MMTKCVLVFTLSTRYSCQILMKYELSGELFDKYSNIKFHENPSSGSSFSMRMDGRTDRHDEANSHFSHICERA